MKRLAIYATYKSVGSRNEYVEYMADELSGISDVCIVSNSKLNSWERERYKKYKRVYERSDAGYDVGAYSETLERLSDEGVLDDYDELILLNDSIFGPFYPIEDMFYEMDKSNPDADFWGITKRGINTFDGSEKVYPEHIQLYFYVIRSKMFHDKCFRDFMKNMPDEITDFRSAIFKYEFMFTDFFVKRGFQYGVYCNTDEYMTDNPSLNLSPYHYDMYNLIKNKKCPFLKRKLFTGEFLQREYTDAFDLRRAFDFIESNTTYNVNLIWSHILSTYNIVEIMSAMHLIEVLGDRESYKELYDLSSEVMQGVHANGGFYDIDEDHILFIKCEVCENQPSTLAKSYMNNLIANLFADRDYMNDVLELFRQEDRLGLVIPPIDTYGNIKKSFCGCWASEDVMREMCDKYGIHAESPAIHHMNGFIIKKDILSEDLMRDIQNDPTGTVIQMLPVFAQNKGYYTKLVINKAYVFGYVDNLTYISKSMIDGIDESENDLSIKDLKIKKNILRVKTFAPSQSVYIYGAGNLAMEIIERISDDIEIKGIVVTDVNGNEKNLKGHNIIPFEKLQDDDVFFILAVGNKNNKIVAGMIEERGYHNYITIVE